MNASGSSAVGGDGKGRRAARTLRVALGAVAWILFLLLVLFTAMGLFWVTLPIVMLGSIPAGKVLAISAAVLALTGLMFWIMIRFVASRVVVLWVGGVLAGLTLFAYVVWAPTSYDDALFLARTMAWGDSDVLDYQKLPGREVAKAPSAFHFEEQLTPNGLRTIEYDSGEGPQEVTLDDFLRDSDTTSFIVIKDGKIRYESYFNGYDRDSIVTSFSTAKSFISALVGIAISEGRIGSVDDTVVTYLPELRGRGLDELTIRDLLLMSTGVRFVYDGERGAKIVLWPFGDEALCYIHPALRNLALGLPASSEPPGAAFKYNPYNTILLGLVLERTTRVPVADYLSEKIWQPLGMEYPATWSLDSTDDGFEKMESGLNGRAVDFAKFGQLFLDDGTWNGRQVVSQQWVAASTTPDPADDRPWLVQQAWREGGGYYKYQWWGRKTSDGGYRYSARGHLGQMIAVFPATRTVVVRFGTSEGDVDWDEVAAAVDRQLE